MTVFNLSPKIGLGGNVFGKDVANFQLFQALARHGGMDQVDFLMTQPLAPADVAARLVGDHPGAARIATAPLLDQDHARASGTLLRGSAEIAPLSWRRRRGLGDAAYSLIGLIHTLAPPAIREDIAAATISAVREWDAIVCTSPSVKAAVEQMFDEWEAHLAERFGGRSAIRPQLPLIPLGVDGARFAAAADRPAAGRALRDRLGVGADEILLLWVGRLSFFEKAFPQSMMRAAEQAATLSGRRIHLAMAGWFPNPARDDPMYCSAAAACAPSVPFHLLDGNDPALVDDAWAAADIFVSLVDNIQETFGITPIEAMAAGVPVVVSDWDGYRYTVRDGIEGFLVPTLGAPAGALGDWLVDTHMFGLRSYQEYAAIVAQHTPVHIGRAANAIARLAADADLRRTMGAAGRRRIADMFDWRVVAPQFAALAQELGSRRPAPSACASGARHPVRGDPFRDFAGFASSVMQGGTILRPGVRDMPAALRAAQQIELDRFAANWRASPEELVRAAALIAERGQISIAALLDAFPPERRRAVNSGVLWMAKLGVIDWLGDGV